MRQRKFAKATKKTEQKIVPFFNLVTATEQMREENNFLMLRIKGRGDTQRTNKKSTFPPSLTPNPPFRFLPDRGGRDAQE